MTDLSPIKTFLSGLSFANFMLSIGYYVVTDEYDRAAYHSATAVFFFLLAKEVK